MYESLKVIEQPAQKQVIEQPAQKQVIEKPAQKYEDFSSRGHVNFSSFNSSTPKNNG